MTTWTHNCQITNLYYLTQHKVCTTINPCNSNVLWKFYLKVRVNNSKLEASICKKHSKKNVVFTAFKFSEKIYRAHTLDNRIIFFPNLNFFLTCRGRSELIGAATQCGWHFSWCASGWMTPEGTQQVWRLLHTLTCNKKQLPFQWTAPLTFTMELKCLVHMPSYNGLHLTIK